MRFLKFLNRGIVLGVLILIVLTGVVIAQTVQFKQNIPDIERDVRAYIDGLPALTIPVEGQTDAERKDQAAAFFGKTLSKRPVFKNDQNIYTGAMRNFAENVNIDVNKTVKTCTTELLSVKKVSKYGPNLATATVEFVVEATYTSRGDGHDGINVQVPFLDQSIVPSDVNPETVAVDDEDEPNEPAEALETVKTTRNTVTVEGVGLRKEDGTWKFCKGADMFRYNP